ncbi:MAG TPA: hypothetical protein VIN03_01965 [Roseateles sp.]
MTSFARCALAFALAGLALATSAAPLQVRSLTLKPGADAGQLEPADAGWADGSVKMPFVEPASPVAARINEALYLALGMVAPQKPGASFTPPAEQLPHGTASQDFNVARNDGRLLVIVLSAEGCGAYCENYDTAYNFDARTGWLIGLQDLVQPAALEALGRRIAKESRRRYAEQIKTLRQELAAARKRKAKADDIEDLEQRIELNQGCLGGEGGLRNAADVVRYAGLSLAAPGLTLTVGRCSNHAMRALDDVGEIIVTVPPAELKPLLTAYGRAVVIDEGEAGPPAQPFGQLLRGKVGQAAITLRLERPYADGSVSGHYYYDRYRKLIPLSGKREGDTLTLTETIDGQQASFRLTLRGTTLSGQWQGSGRTLPVSLDW